MSMRMQSKMNIFFAVYMLGGLVVMLLSARPVGGMSILPPLCWFLLFGVVQFFLFRCPHCRRVAFMKKNGSVSPFAGSACRRCGKEY